MLDQGFVGATVSLPQNETPFYTIENIESDVTDESAVKAREKALLEGQRKALELLLQRLSGTSTSWETEIKSLKDSDISNLVADFEVTQEKSSTVRYIATLTYRFKLHAINELLARFGIIPHERSIPSLLIIPILKIGTKQYLWEDENVWRMLWQEGTLSSSNIPLRIPLGDLEDIQILDSSQAMALNLPALDQMAERYKATGGAIVVVATLNSDIISPMVKESIPLNAHSVDVSILDPSLPQTEVKIPMPPLQEGSEDSITLSRHLLDRALRETLRFLNSEWHNNIPRKSIASQDMEFTASFSSKNEWLRIRRALDTLKNDHVIVSYLVQSLNPQTASIMIKFRGEVSTILHTFQAQNLNITSKEVMEETKKSSDPFKSSPPMNGNIILNAPF